MITGDMILAHIAGDYLFQSDWMALNKTKSSFAAACHALTYAIPFMLLHPSVLAICLIVGTHFIIDRWRLARFVVYAKNLLAPMSEWQPWSECSATGYHKDRPPWMAVWLLIIGDNAMHIFCNGFAFYYFPC